MSFKMPKIESLKDNFLFCVVLGISVVKIVGLYLVVVNSGFKSSGFVKNPNMSSLYENASVETTTGFTGEGGACLKNVT